MLDKIKHLYYRYLKTPTDYARWRGVKIGSNCFINTHNWGSEPYLIKIGDNVQVTDNVHFATHGGAHVARQSDPDFDIFGKIEVMDWAYIGSGSYILPGVTIGEKALIAAGSVVTKSVPAHEVWGGNPARRICTVEQYIEKNQKYNVSTKNLSQESKKSYF